MATYLELHSLTRGDSASTLLAKVSVACILAADAIRTEDGATPNNANRLVWAKRTFVSPEEVAREMLPALLAQNKDNMVGAITGASDLAIQTAVDAAVNIFATG